jgi:hypothetical protein
MSGPGILPIVECGDPVLRRPAEPVSPSDLRTSELQLLIAQMRATMEAAPGVGLAAPQVGVPIQLAVLHDGPERWGQLTEDERTARERAGVQVVCDYEKWVRSSSSRSAAWAPRPAPARRPGRTRRET